MKITEVKLTGKSGLGLPRGTVTVAEHTISICIDRDIMDFSTSEETLYEVGVLDENGLIENDLYEKHKNKIKELISLLERYRMGDDGAMRGLTKKEMLEAVNIIVTWALDRSTNDCF
jgi:hypothetical protein